MNIDEFVSELKKINIEITQEQLSKLNRYYEMIVETNKYMNLTAILEKEDVYLKHFYDSLTINKIVDLNNIETLCDIGTGAGFPGIVIKICFPQLKITLVDSLNKRLEFLRKVVEELNLNNIEIIHARIEEYGIKNREKFDLVTARAVAPLNILLEYAIPLVKKDCYFIAMKSNVENEIKDSSNALIKLDSKIVEIQEFSLPIEHSKRTIVKIKKENITKTIYPRKYIEIKKKAL